MTPLALELLDATLDELEITLLEEERMLDELLTRLELTDELDLIELETSDDELDFTELDTSEDELDLRELETNDEELDLIELADELDTGQPLFTTP